MMPIAKSKTVVFVHGMFMTPLAWEKWEAHFAAKGYKTLAPAWPLHDLPIEDQRKNHPNPKLGELTLDTVLSHYRQVLKGLDEKPILVGHSMGGLIVQILLAEGLGAAGIAIDSAPPKGVISLKYSFLKSNWPVISPSAKVSEPFFLPQNRNPLTNASPFQNRAGWAKPQPKMLQRSISRRHDHRFC
jgi:pimeloyl-ACP methyl ester carboxylesterase